MRKVVKATPPLCLVYNIDIRSSSREYLLDVIDVVSKEVDRFWLNLRTTYEVIKMKIMRSMLCSVRAI